jgi:hypothetical protein
MSTLSGLPAQTHEVTHQRLHLGLQAAGQSQGGLRGDTQTDGIMHKEERDRKVEEGGRESNE